MQFDSVSTLNDGNIVIVLGRNADSSWYNVRLPNGMTGWTLRDVANNTYTFPAFTLQPGTAVNVWVKAGVNTAVDLYWGRGSAVWNNAGDTAYLRDGGGADVDVCTYAGGGVSASCD